MANVLTGAGRKLFVDGKSRRTSIMFSAVDRKAIARIVVEQRFRSVTEAVVWAIHQALKQERAA